MGFGIVGDPAAGRAMFDRMPVIEAGTVKTLELYPLERAERVPDVVVEDKVEKLMWIALAGLNAEGRRRVESSSAILRYFDCQVGCNTCGNLCPARAISFPELEELRAL